MPKETSLANLSEDLQSTSKELLGECDELTKAAREYANRENAYRMARAKAMLEAPKDTVDMKKAFVDSVTEKERLAAHVSEGLLDATRERVRSLRAVLSALQTIAGSYKAEADFSRTGPRF